MEPQQGLLKIVELEKWAHKAGDKSLGYSFEIIKYDFLIKSKRNIDTAVERNFIRLIDKLEEDKMPLLKAYAMFLLSERYWHRAKEYGPAFKYALSAYNIYSKIPAADFPLKFLCLYELGSKYHSFKDYEATKRIMFEARNTPVYKEPGMFNILNLIGLCHRSTEQYDSAVYYFKEAYKIISPSHKIVWQAILSGNLGITYYYMGRYDEAIPLLETDIRLCTEKNRATINAIKSLAILADIYLQKNENKKAAELLAWSYRIIHTEPAWDKYGILEVVYPIMARSYRANGDMKLAYAFMDSAVVVKNKLAKENSGLILAGAQHIIDGERHVAELRNLEDEKKRETLIGNSLVAIIILIGIIALLSVNRQKLVHKREEERLAAEKQLLDNELSYATTQLDLFTKSIHEKNELIDRFSAELAHINGQSSHTADHDDLLLQLQESTILTDEEWENFRKMFEKVHKGYLRRLKEKRPGLSPADTRFMALSKLKLSNKEMAGMLGISVDAVRMSKHRLRKKLGLSEEETIEELVDSL
jgi:tetratricopeptide (TPR) repeat protein